CRTATVWKTLCPFWGEEYQVHLPPAFHAVAFYVMDEDALSRDDVIGKVCLTRDTLAAHPKGKTPGREPVAHSGLPPLLPHCSACPWPSPISETLLLGCFRAHAHGEPCLPSLEGPLASSGTLASVPWAPFCPLAGTAPP
ncbi:ras gtpase-activating protein 4, partial [Lynx pardinus]